MASAFGIITAAVAGSLLGAVFYVGLWFTVRKGLSSTHPAKLFVASLVLRVGAAIAGFYYISHGDWRLLAAAMGGFLLSRTYALRLVGRPVPKHLANLGDQP
jgi:F1F0 ATPase subunit 2